MKYVKRAAGAAICLAMLTGAMWQPVYAAPAETDAEEYPCQLYARVTDAGQVVSRMEIDFGTEIDPESVTPETFTVHAVGSSAETQELFTSLGMEVLSDGDYDIDREIVRTEVNGNIVTLFFNEAEGGTVSYVSLEGVGIPNNAGGRNYPVELTYTITQNEDILTAGGDTITGNYSCDNSVIDPEVDRFESVIVEDGINYQYHKGTNDTLIVWFHGGGEGDQDNLTKNNVAQMLANRGTVAWVSEGAQDIFGDATVVAFQAPNRWYQGDQSALYTRVYQEIEEIVEANGIDRGKIMVTGCSMGGYMSTQMLMKYPDYFSTALIICPAINVRVVEPTPTDEQLAEIAKSDTKIWLVQAETDSSVTAETSERFFNMLTDGMDITETTVEQEINSDFTTYETADGKYKRTVYTTEDARITCAEDYNQDGEEEAVTYSDHWTWIYTLNNNPTDASETTIWEWAKASLEDAAKGVTAASDETTDSEEINPEEEPAPDVNENIPDEEEQATDSTPESNTNSGTSSVLWAVIGAVVGAAAAVLVMRKKKQ